MTMERKADTFVERACDPGRGRRGGSVTSPVSGGGGQ